MMTSLPRITLVLFCFFLNLAASQTKQIKLKLTSNLDTFNLNEYQSDLRPLSYTDNFIGVPKLDSLKFHFVAMDYVQYAYDKYRDNKLEKSRALAYFQRLKIDTLSLSQREINQELIVLVGFKKNKQILIADTNNNNDFSDEIVYEYNVNQKAISTDQLPSVYKFEYFQDNKINYFERRFVLVPDNENAISQKIPKADIPYLSFIKFTDVWVGELDGYEFYFPDFYSNSSFYVKDKNYSFSEDFVSNNQYKFHFNDTIAINNKNYTISRQLKMDLLTLNPSIKGPSKRFLVGDTVPLNYSFKDLNNSTFFLKDAIKDKSFLLLEFWGTWCGPCLKFSPQISRFYNLNKEKLGVLGIAVDDDTDKVKKFVVKHNINWQQAFVKLNSTTTLLAEMNVIAYPTIMLLDKKGKIVFVGSGDSGSLEKISDIIVE